MEKNDNFKYLLIVTLVVIVAILSLIFMTQLNYMANNNQRSPVAYVVGNDGLSSDGGTVVRLPVANKEVQNSDSSSSKEVQK